MLVDTNSLKIHDRNIEKLMIEIYKCLNRLSPPIMNDFFTYRQNNYNIRNFRELDCENVNTINCGLNTLSYKGSQLWQQLPEFIKKSENINSFKLNLKSWRNYNCSCNICKDYIQGLGYV